MDLAQIHGVADDLPPHNSNLMRKRLTMPVALDNFFIEVAEITRFSGRFFKTVYKPRYEFAELFRQCFLIGNKSLGLVLVTGFIMGLVLTIQSRPTLARFGAESWLPGMVAVSIIREIGP